MYVDMWKDLLKWSPLDEKYCHPAMEGFIGLFRVSWGRGSRTSLQYDGCICVMCRVIHVYCNICVMYVQIVHTKYILLTNKIG